MSPRIIAFGAIALAFAILAGKVGADSLLKPQSIATTTASPSPSAADTPSTSPSPADNPQQTAPLQAPRPSAEAETEQPIATATVQITAAKLMAEPGANSAVVAQLNQNESVEILQGTVLEGSARWYLVSSGDRRGYVLSTSLSRPVMAEQPKPQAQQDQGAAIQLPIQSL